MPPRQWVNRQACGKHAKNKEVSQWIVNHLCRAPCLTSPPTLLTKKPIGPECRLAAQAHHEASDHREPQRITPLSLTGSGVEHMVRFTSAEG